MNKSEGRLTFICALAKFEENSINLLVSHQAEHLNAILKYSNVIFRSETKAIAAGIEEILWVFHQTKLSVAQRGELTD